MSSACHTATRHRSTVLRLCVVLETLALLSLGVRLDGTAAAQQPRASAAPVLGAGVIRGRVVAADTGFPLHNAQVTLSSDRLEAPRTVRTDPQGAYEFREIPSGRFFVAAEKAGYVRLAFGALEPLEPGDAVQLDEGETLERVDLSLPRAGVISGHVVDEYGEPVLDAAVRAYRFQWRGGMRRFVGVSRIPRTDDRGYFRIFGLLPGSYFVSAEPRRPGDGSAEPQDRGQYVPTYYPGTPNLADAVQVTIGVGEERTEINFPVIAARAARVSGTAFDTAGQPVTGARVSLVRREGRLGFVPVGQTRARGDGRFEFSGVAPGSYTVQVWAHRTGARAEPEFASVRLTLAGQDVGGLLLRTTRGGTVRGRLLFEGGSPADFTPGRVQVSAPLVSVDLPSVSSDTPRARVGADLTFTIPGLVGPRFIRVDGLPRPWSLKSVRYNGVDVTDAPLVFEGEAEASGVDLVLTNAAAAVTGVAVESDGTPAALGSVIVFPEDEALRVPHSRFVRLDRADRNGQFSIEGLPPGRYLAAAIEYVWQGEWSDPAFLERLSRSAQPFSLADGEQQHLTLTFSRLR